MKIPRAKRRPRLANAPGCYFSALPIYRHVTAAEARIICDKAEAERPKPSSDRMAVGE